VFNGVKGIGQTFSAADLDGTKGHMYHTSLDTVAPASWDAFPFTVFFHDLNCDGEEDLVFSDPRADTVDTANVNNGRLWVIWGPFAKKQYTDISTLSTTEAMKFQGLTS